MRYKWSPPPLPVPCLRSDRLFELLDRSQARLTFLQGGPASGKSLLAHTWLQARGLDFVWYSFDAADSDALVFLRCLTDALAFKLPGLDLSCRAMLSALPGQGDSLRHFVGLLSDELERQLTAPLVIVLDEVQLGLAHPAIVKLLTDWAAFLPEQLRLLLVGKAVTVPEWLLLSPALFAEIAPAELHLTTNESAELAACLGLNLTPGEVTGLQAKTHGWIGGLALLLQMIRRQPGLSVQTWLDRRESDELLFAFALRQWLGELAAPMRDFLLRTAHLPLIRLDLCQELVQDPGPWVDSLYQLPLFAYPVPGKGLCYHPTFRTYLLNEFQRSYGPAEQQAFYSQLGLTLAEEFPEEALGHYFAAGNYAAAAERLHRLRSIFFQSQRFETFQLLLEKFPADFVAGLPMLQIDLAEVLRHRGQLDRAQHLLEPLTQAGVLPSVQGYASLSLGAIACQRGDIPLALNWIDQARSRLAPVQAETGSDSSSEALSDKEALAFLANLEGVCHLLDGGMEAAHAALERAFALYGQLGDRFNQAKVRHNEGLALTWTGRLNEARQAYQDSCQLLEAMQGLVPAMTEHNLAVVNLYLGHFAQAQALLEQGFAKAQQLGQQTEQLYALTGLGRLHSRLGNFAQAAGFLEQAGQILQRQRNPLWETYWTLIQAEFHCAQGQPEQAHPLLQGLLERIPSLLSDARYLEWRIKLAEVALLSGQLTEAESHLLQVEAELKQKNYQYHLARVSFMLAQLYRQTSRQPQAQRFLTQAQTLCRQQDYESLAREYSSQPVLATPAESPALTFRFDLFGRLRGWIGAEPMPMSRWGGKKTRLLLAVLLQEKEGLSWQQISQRLADEQDVSRSSVSTWINRLRSALETPAGKQAILFSDGLYRFNPAMPISVDSRECDFAITQAQAAAPGSARRIQHWEKALSHVGGEFLSEFASLYWVQLEQERYKRLIRSACEEILAHYFALQQYPQVQKWSEWALKSDPCFEEAHLYCLRAFEALGNRRGVVKHHQRMTVIFARELNSSPPDAATVILNRILKKH